MNYIAQWFQQSTWDTIARQGPTAIAPPVTHFKIQSSRKYGAWIVSTDCINIKEDLLALHRTWKQQGRELVAVGHHKTPISRIFWRFQTTEALQESNVPTPPRIPWLTQNKPSGTIIDGSTSASTSVSYLVGSSVSVRQIASAKPSSNERKRKRKSSPEPESTGMREVPRLDHISS
jgi:hypothetical protein